MPELWMTRSNRVRTWPYRALPAAGDTIRYMDDGYDAVITAVRSTHIVMSDSTIYRRRIEFGRIWAWIVSHNYTHNALSSTFAETAPPKGSAPMRPLRSVTPYVPAVQVIRAG